jgi:hypothetical protein
VKQQAGILLVVSLYLPFAARAQDTSSASASTPEGVSTITGREIGAHMRFLASDLMKGRDTASPETRIAAQYLASWLQADGAEPAGDSTFGRTTYFQRFPLEVVTPQDDKTTLSLIVEQDGSKRTIPLQVRTDFTVMARGVTNGEIEAPVVFAGHGVVDKDAKIDEYAGLNVKNRVVLVLPGMPERKADSDGAPAARPRRLNFNAKADAARERGALAVLTFRDSQQPIRLLGPGQRGGRGTMRLVDGETSLPLVTLDDSVKPVLLGASAATPNKLTPGPLEGVRVQLGIATARELKDDQNVVGIFPGTDPEKKKEVIIFSAHYDHVGVGTDGQVFNGSDDNASGTSALLDIAGAFAQAPRPARSVAFLWVSGEEQGLFGSKWFSDHISLPKDYRIVADINLDMVSRNDAKTISITPSPKHADHSTLIPAALEACRAEGITSKFDVDSFYERTDSYSFARKGIPVIFFFNGTHADYHRPTDDVDKADFEKAARVARVAYRVGWQMAQAAEAPTKITAEQTADAGSAEKSTKKEGDTRSRLDTSTPSGRTEPESGAANSSKPAQASERGAANPPQPSREDADSGSTAFESGPPVKTGDPQLTLIWNSTADLDLHAMEPGGSHIYWESRKGSQGGDLDVDDIDGYGPENANWSPGKAPPGEYKWYVHYYGGLGGKATPTRWKVRLRQDGQFRIYEGELAQLGDKSQTYTFKLDGAIAADPSSAAAEKK